MIRLSDFRQIKFLTLVVLEHVMVGNAAELMEMVPGILFSRGGKNRGQRCDYRGQGWPICVRSRKLFCAHRSPEWFQ
jgi:hypothetical protein